VTRASIFVVAGGLVFAFACSSNPKMPTGPAPEYEDPPAPSWLKDAGAAQAPAPVPIPIEPTPMPSDSPPPPVTDGGVAPSS